MSKKSRDKGASAERQVASLLSDWFPTACRNLAQYQQSSGRDLDNTEPWCVQIKQQERLTPKAKRVAYREAVSATCDDYPCPAVIFRENRHRNWRVYLCAVDAFNDAGLAMIEMTLDEWMKVA